MRLSGKAENNEKAMKSRASAIKAADSQSVIGATKAHRYHLAGNL
jgi:hypothetical protein